jgi:predicted patatin/cPLA2 family phospholipase
MENLARSDYLDLQHYTEPAKRGVKYRQMLPKGTALVLEGGGTRANFTAGVLEAFMEKGIMFPYIIGVSAGVGNALSYISGQSGRNRTLVEKYINHRYAGYRNLLKYGSIFGYDYIFETIPQKHLYWDKEAYDENETRFLIGATDCHTAKAVWFEKHEMCSKFTVARASCSVPFLSRVVKHNGLDLLDGGIAAPIPIDQSISDGNTFHVAVLTRNANYTKSPFKYERFLRFYYRKYPKLVETLITRHDAYHRQITLCEQLEKEGKAMVIRPILPLNVGRATIKVEKLLTLQDEGFKEGRLAVQRLCSQP